MSKFNLLEEPWISVLCLENGRQEEVSVLEVFRNAKQYRGLAGDTPTQDFAVLRMLLAILQTVFSRYDSEGRNLVCTDEKMRQIQEIPDDEDERDDYENALKDTWKDIWEQGAFPDVLYQYLDLWKDHFYLLDETYPFYQVTKDDLDGLLPKGKKPSPISGRFMNRTISESNNKTALFSPRTSEKDVMYYSQLARWLITFQGYTGQADKAKIKKDNNSKGWLFNIGGIYSAGDNLFETLLLNYIPVHPVESDRYTIQKPCWEYSGKEVADRLLREKPIANLSELYTNWSRAIFIDPKMNLPGPVIVQSVKLPDIVHTDQFLEPMTIWKYNDSGDNKGHFTPKKHKPQQAMWRSFGLIALPTSSAGKQRRPGIQEQIDATRMMYGSRLITLRAVSMQDDGNSASQVPADEITDELRLNDIVLSDGGSEGWIIRINDIVCLTTDVVNKIYWGFLKEVSDIQNLSDKKTTSFILKETEELYQDIDLPFREWIRQILPEDSKENQIIRWKQELKKIVIRRAQKFGERTNNRELTVIEKDGHEFNIVTAYLSLLGRLKRVLD